MGTVPRTSRNARESPPSGKGTTAASTSGGQKAFTTLKGVGPVTRKGLQAYAEKELLTEVGEKTKKRSLNIHTYRGTYHMPKASNQKSFQRLSRQGSPTTSPGALAGSETPRRTVHQGERASLRNGTSSRRGTAVPRCAPRADLVGRKNLREKEGGTSEYRNRGTGNNTSKLPAGETSFAITRGKGLRKELWRGAWLGKEGYRKSKEPSTSRLENLVVFRKWQMGFALEAWGERVPSFGDRLIVGL